MVITTQCHAVYTGYKKTAVSWIIIASGHECMLHPLQLPVFVHHGDYSLDSRPSPPGARVEGLESRLSDDARKAGEWSLGTRLLYNHDNPCSYPAHRFYLAWRGGCEIKSCDMINRKQPTLPVSCNLARSA